MTDQPKPTIESTNEEIASALLREADRLYLIGQYLGVGELLVLAADRLKGAKIVHPTEQPKPGTEPTNAQLIAEARQCAAAKGCIKRGHEVEILVKRASMIHQLAARLEAAMKDKGEG